MEPRLQLKRYSPQAGLKPGTARLLGQRLTGVTGAPTIEKTAKLFCSET